MNIVRSFNTWLKYRDTVSQLDRMSSRELRDVGIERGQIRQVARAAAANF